MSLAAILPIYSLLCLSILDLGAGKGQRGRQRPSTLCAPCYGGGDMITKLIWEIHVCRMQTQRSSWTRMRLPRAAAMCSAVRVSVLLYGMLMCSCLQYASTRIVLRMSWRATASISCYEQHNTTIQKYSSFYNTDKGKVHHTPPETAGGY